MQVDNIASKTNHIIFLVPGSRVARILFKNLFTSSSLVYKPGSHSSFVIYQDGKYVVTLQISIGNITRCTRSPGSVTIIEWVSLVGLEARNLGISLMVTYFTQAYIGPRR